MGEHQAGVLSSKLFSLQGAGHVACSEDAGGCCGHAGRRAAHSRAGPHIVTLTKCHRVYVTCRHSAPRKLRYSWFPGFVELASAVSPPVPGVVVLVQIYS